MLTQNQYKPLQQYVAEQIAASPAFAEELARAREGARLGLALTEMREARGLTQRELSEETGIKQPMLARIERGQMPTLPTLSRIARALNARVMILPEAGIIVEALTQELSEPARQPIRRRKTAEAVAAQ